MKKLLIVVHHLKIGGGIEKVGFKLGELLVSEGYDVSYFTYYNVNNEYPIKGNKYCLNENLKCSFIGKILRFFSRGLKISNYCKRNNVDCVISLGETSNFPSIISKIFGNKSKIISTVHHSIKDYKKGVLYRFIKLLYRFSDCIVTLTNYEKENLIENFGCRKDKVFQIPNGIDLKNIENERKKSLGEYSKYFGKNFTFISIGRLVKLKNYTLLLETFKNFNNKYCNTQLIILGDGELKNELVKNAPQNVFFLGNQLNVYKFLDKSDCFILTSSTEAFGIVYLEAMACGLPIIATCTQGASEILDDNKGILVDIKGKDLFNKMELLYNNKSIQNFYSEQSSKSIIKYDYQNVIREWKKIL